MKPSNISAFLLLALFGHAASATTVYTIEGRLTSSSIYPNNPALLSLYSAYGLAPDVNLSFTVEVANEYGGGYKTLTSGAQESVPTFETVSGNSQTLIHRGYAGLLASDIDFSNSNISGVKQNNYFSNSDTTSSQPARRGSSGSISVGNELYFSKSGSYGDSSVYVGNWVTGDKLAGQVNFNAGAGQLHAGGFDFIVTQKIVNGVVVSEVPLPAPALLFASACMALVRVFRADRRSKP